MGNSDHGTTDTCDCEPISWKTKARPRNKLRRRSAGTAQPVHIPEHIILSAELAFLACQGGFCWA
jgi:hypothetical protein